MTGLRGEAAIIGIAELPAERRPSRPPLFTLDQYALLAKMVVEDAGIDPACINGLLTPWHRRVGDVRAGHPVRIPGPGVGFR